MSAYSKNDNFTSEFLFRKKEHFGIQKRKGSAAKIDFYITFFEMLSKTAKILSELNQRKKKSNSEQKFDGNSLKYVPN